MTKIKVKPKMTSENSARLSRYSALVALSVVRRRNYGLLSYFLSLLFRLSNSERILSLSHDQNESKTFCKKADADGFVRGETLAIFLGMLGESELKVQSCKLKKH